MTEHNDGTYILVTHPKPSNLVTLYFMESDDSDEIKIANFMVVPRPESKTSGLMVKEYFTFDIKIREDIQKISKLSPDDDEVFRIAYEHCLVLYLIKEGDQIQLDIERNTWIPEYPPETWIQNAIDIDITLNFPSADEYVKWDNWNKRLKDSR